MEPSKEPVLIAGATGFVGRALTTRLRADGYRVRALVRDSAKAAALQKIGVETVDGDLVSSRGLLEALQGVRLAYYMVHSLGASGAGYRFAELDRRAAQNFVAGANAAGLERIVYVGGLGDEAPLRSPHLESRREVGRILRSGDPALTTLRAAIIVGAGGSSFEMLVQLVEKLPVMICPRWVNSRCQPIGLPDLVRYLVGCLEEPATEGQTYDVGGPEVLRYREMIERVGRILGRHPRLIIVPWLTPSLSSHWVGFITEVPSGVARPLVEGMTADVICQENRIREVLPGPLASFESAVRAAIEPSERRPESPLVPRARWRRGRAVTRQTNSVTPRGR
jgi:uncharacterized protein YbjT (DUF2867 family)